MDAQQAKIEYMELQDLAETLLNEGADVNLMEIYGVDSLEAVLVKMEWLVIIHKLF
jgi:hypothetical protein